MRSFYLLTKDNCPLCIQAIQIIHLTELEEPIELGVVDIATDADLLEEYATLVPVLIRGSDEQELKWPFQAEKLKEFLQS
ncbi:glutaredoxin family protein [Aliidiomarina haloalkalitolerans]|uniref:Thioredoxin family protein n=1 Tax=Aliidiomarina haloalkalitolerans TaxID=859059 RepID=A0A432VYA1_9GAMM|nr:glutaredoxin family protein [Aliidiomarina haloalkalitolerans]MCL4409663.1 glutaredoxin family protein [Gammaproteobacteria bacterium]RUO21654.1 thioredoxin family protein [Aliidiomarina haloalkalitolerans]